MGRNYLLGLNRAIADGSNRENRKAKSHSPPFSTT
jgi:hypothetical protein